MVSNYSTTDEAEELMSEFIDYREYVEAQLKYRQLTRDNFNLLSYTKYVLDCFDEVFLDYIIYHDRLVDVDDVRTMLEYIAREFDNFADTDRGRERRAYCMTAVNNLLVLLKPYLT